MQQNNGLAYSRLVISGRNPSALKNPLTSVMTVRHTYQILPLMSD